jgi:hypothetical protein
LWAAHFEKKKPAFTENNRYFMGMVKVIRCILLRAKDGGVPKTMGPREEGGEHLGLTFGSTLCKGPRRSGTSRVPPPRHGTFHHVKSLLLWMLTLTLSYYKNRPRNAGPTPSI